MAGERWLFTEEQLANTPSRQCGIDAEKEKCYRQQAANFMQEMGQRLTVSQLCINTGIVYLHRFYMFQSFTRFHRNSMAQACLFLAAKVEEQPRKLEHVIKVAHMILHRDQPPLDTKSVAYLDQAQELVINENILLQTLGFELQVDHPHAHIVKTCNLIKAPKDLTQTSYFLATNSLHLTLMSLRYKPTFVACVCIHLACKWAKFRIPRSSAGKEWWYYVDKDMTSEALEEITQSFLAILDKCPNKFKKKLVSKSAKDEDFFSLMQFPQDKKPKAEASATVTKDSAATCGLSPSTSQHTATGVNHEASPQKSVKNSPKPEMATSRPQVSVPDNTMRRVKTESYLTSLTTKEYFERKERERREREQLEKERQKMAEKKEVTEHTASTERNEPRQHTNIFDQMIGDKQQQQQQHITESPMDETDNASASKNRQSLERTHAQHNYKERYHHKERAEKLPFAPAADLSKEQIKSSSHRPSQRPNPATLASAHLSRDPKQKGRSHERRHPEHRAAPRHEQVKAPVSETAKTKTIVQELGKASPTQVDPEEKVPRIDPEEGEILDDDSPLTVPHDKTTVQQDGDRGYHHQHQHRERRLSGRHTTPPPGHGKTSQPQRHRSPRMATKQDETHGQPQQRAEHKPSKFEVSVPQPTVKLPDIESLHTKALSESKPATPEPGEIVEHGQKHHHKSSRSKTHKKDKHRDRESSHESSGSLKIKLDLKGMGPSKQATTVTSGDERKKEIKLKIKPPSLTGGGDRETHDSGLKMKLKVPPTVMSPVKGNGEPTKLEHHKSGSNAIKLTLSKDSQSGQFTAHKVHNRHAEKAMASRKRPYSPTEAPLLHHQNKLPRNDPERHHHHHHGNDIGAGLLTDNAACAPLIGTSAPNPARVEDIQRQLDRLIAKKTEEIQQQKLGSSKKMHHEGLSNPSSGTFPHPPPAEPSHTLPHS